MVSECRGPDRDPPVRQDCSAKGAMVWRTEMEEPGCAGWLFRRAIIVRPRQLLPCLRRVRTGERGVMAGGFWGDGPVLLSRQARQGGRRNGRELPTGRRGAPCARL